MDQRHKHGNGHARGGPLVSGAPEAGGATTAGSIFGGIGLYPMVLRAIARVARAVEATTYRKLRDLDRGAGAVTGGQGRPRRVKQAAPTPA